MTDLAQRLRSFKPWLTVKRESGLTISVVATCPYCGDEQAEIVVNSDRLEAWIDGELIQDVFPSIARSQRELLISGICDECWDNLTLDMGDEE